MPVVYQFKTGQGDPKAAVAKLKAGIKDFKLDSIFISTNNLTFVAGGLQYQTDIVEPTVGVLRVCVLCVASVEHQKVRKPTPGYFRRNQDNGTPATFILFMLSSRRCSMYHGLMNAR